MPISMNLPTKTVQAHDSSNIVLDKAEPVERVHANKAGLVTADKAKDIVEKHLVGGKVVAEYTLNSTKL